MFNVIHLRGIAISILLCICLFSYAKSTQSNTSDYDKCNKKYDLKYLYDRKSLISSCLRGRRLYYIIDAVNRFDLDDVTLKHCIIGCNEAYTGNGSLSVLENKACRDGCGFQVQVSRTPNPVVQKKSYDLSSGHLIVYRPIMLISSFYSSAYNVIITQTSIYWMKIYDSKATPMDKSEVKRQQDYREVVVSSESTYNWKIIYSYKSSLRNKSLAIVMIASIVLLLWLFITSLIKERKQEEQDQGLITHKKLSLITDEDEKIIDICEEKKLAPIHSSVTLLLA